ncbi:MAG: hypothetical protein MHM6MM_001227 [Cercozoa sp. M6MM]
MTSTSGAPWMSAVAGTAAGCASLGITYPLFTAVVKVQSRQREAGGNVRMLRQLVQQQGMSALYKGFGGAMFSMAVQNGVYYYFFSKFSKLLRAGSSPSRNLAVGFASGVGTVLLTNWLWVVNARQITAKREGDHASFLSTIRELHERHGLSWLVSGMVPSLVLCSNPAVQFAAAALLKRLLARFVATKSKFLKLSPLQIFLIGALSKIAATLATYPIQTLKVRLQRDTTEEEQQAEQQQSAESTCRVTTQLRKLLSIVALAQAMLQEEGALSFFNGLRLKLVQSTLTAALVFLFRDAFLQLIVAMARRRRLRQLEKAAPTLAVSSAVVVTARVVTTQV